MSICSELVLPITSNSHRFERIDKRDKHGVGDPNLDESDIEGYAEDEDVEVTEPVRN